jgi:fatty-acyl-CoA synthase
MGYQFYFKLKPDSFTDDGWFKPVMWYDRSRWLWKDRPKRPYKKWRRMDFKQVALESALMAHPKIKEAAVIAGSRRKWIEKPLATIVLVNKEDTVSDEELTEFYRETLVKYQIPKDYINEVPKLALVNLTKKRLEDCLPKEKLTKQNSWGLK